MFGVKRLKIRVNDLERRIDELERWSPSETIKAIGELEKVEHKRRMRKVNEKRGHKATGDWGDTPEEMISWAQSHANDIMPEVKPE